MIDVELSLLTEHLPRPAPHQFSTDKIWKASLRNGRGAYMAGERTSWVKIRNPKYHQIVGQEKMFEKRSAS